MGLINYEELERPIKAIELTLGGYDAEEQSLILKQVNQRFAAKLQKARINDNLSGMNPGILKNMAKSLMKGDGE